MVIIKHFINYETSEANIIPDPTQYIVEKMMQNGFVEVDADTWQQYIDSHFNDKEEGF